MLPMNWRRNGLGHSVPQAPAALTHMKVADQLADREARATPSAGETIAPAVDVTETDEAFEVLVDLPGMAQDAIELSLLDSRLTISAERPVPAAAEGRTIRRLERRYGRFSRTIEFHRPVLENEITATYIDGVLRLYAPKSPAARPRRIEIATG